MNGRTNVTTGPNGGAIDIPLDPPTAFVAEGSHEKISLTWTDPKDKYATPEGEAMEDTNQLVSTWDHTVIVRKTDGYPATPDDGILVISSGQRNQYQTTPYIDTGLTNQTQYYYAAFAFNTDGVPSEPAYVDCFLYGYDTVLENNSWEYIDRACSEGLHTSLWEIGDTKSGIADGDSMTYAISAFDTDDLSDGSGKASISFTSVNLMATHTQNMNTSGYDDHSYRDTYMYQYLRGILKNNLSDDLSKYLKTVIKKSAKPVYTSGGETYYPYESNNCQLFNLDSFESGISQNIHQIEHLYSYPYYTTAANRLKDNKQWVLRDFANDDTGGTPYVYYISSTGIYNSYYADKQWNICFGFCIGKSTV